MIEELFFRLDLPNYLIFFTACINLLLAYFIFIKGRNKKSNISYSIVTFGIVLWSFGMFLYRGTSSQFLVLWYAQFLYFVSGIIPAALLYFSFVFPRNKLDLKLWQKFIIFLPPILLIFSSFIPGFIVEDIVIHRVIENEMIFGWGYNLWGIYLICYFVWAFINLFIKFKRSSGVIKTQIKYILIGGIISAILGSVTNLILPAFKYTNLGWLGQSFTIIMVGFVAYAITRYRLMDIRLIIFRSIAFGLIISIITITFAIISGLIALFFENLTGVRSNVIAGLIVGVLLSLAYQPLRRLIERATNKILYKKRYDPDKLIAEVTEVSSSILNLKQLLTEISKDLSDAFQFEKIGIVLLSKDKKKLEIAYKQGFAEGMAEQLVGYKNVISIMYKEFKRNPGIQVIDEMKAQYDSGEFQPVDSALLGILHQNDIALIIPLRTKEKLIGLIAVGMKKSGDPYNNQDLSTLSLIAGQAGIAIENARLYEEQKEFANILQQKVEEATKELRKANKQLREMDQMKSDFISIASHQLRTPLTVIKGYISMMNEGSFGKIPDKIKNQLQKVFISNERLIGLVENLLDISRIESGRQEYKWERLQLEEMASTVVDNLRNNAKVEGLKLTFSQPKKPLPKVLADRKIHEVMINFVDNAIKYTKKGRVEVSIAAEPEGMVTFTVQDTGVGLTKEAMVHLFKKFSRAQGSFQLHTEGVGLGLFVAKMLIDAHKGVIGAESEGKDKGSRFFFSIPINGPQSKNQPQEAITRYLGKD